MIVKKTNSFIGQGIRQSTWLYRECCFGKTDKKPAYDLHSLSLNYSKKWIYVLFKWRSGGLEASISIFLSPVKASSLILQFSTLRTTKLIKLVVISLNKFSSKGHNDKRRNVNFRSREATNRRHILAMLRVGWERSSKKPKSMSKCVNCISRGLSNNLCKIVGSGKLLKSCK